MRLATPLVWEEYHKESYHATTPLGWFFMEPATNFLEDEPKEWIVLYEDEPIAQVKSQEEASREAEIWLFNTIRQTVVFEVSDT